MKRFSWNRIWENKLKAVENNSYDPFLDKYAIKAYEKYQKWISIKDKLIIEIGFGSGRNCLLLAKLLNKSNIIGMELSMSSIKVAKTLAKRKKIHNTSFLRGDLFKMPFQDDFFNILYSEGVVELFYNYEDALKEMLRVIKPKGKLIVSVVNWYCFPHTIRKKILGKRYEYGFEKSFKHSELRKIFEKLNLKEIEIVGFYPQHSILRLGWLYSSRRISRLFSITGHLLGILIKCLDIFFSNWVSNKFGHEIIIKGKKI